MDIAFLVAPKSVPLNALVVDRVLKSGFPQVKASSVATHTFPWIVILHMEEEVTQQERDEIQTILDNLDPPEEEFLNNFE